jgi:hypothetical protein
VGIHTKFSPFSIITTNPAGKITVEFKEKCLEQARNLERPRIILERKEKPFNHVHRNLIDKHLCEFEESQKEKMEKNRRKIQKLKSTFLPHNLKSQQRMNDHSSIGGTSMTSHYGSHQSGISASSSSTKIYSRMTLFKNLLQVAEPPKASKKRFDQLRHDNIESEYSNFSKADDVSISAVQNTSSSFPSIPESLPAPSTTYSLPLIGKEAPMEPSGVGSNKSTIANKAVPQIAAVVDGEKREGGEGKQEAEEEQDEYYMDADGFEDIEEPSTENG